MEWLLLILWSALIPAVTIRLGGVLPLERGILFVGSAVLFILVTLGRRSRPFREIPRRLWLPLLFFLFLTLFTLIPLPLSTLKPLSPLSFAIWNRIDLNSLASEIEGHELNRPIREALSPDVFQNSPRPLSIFPEGTRTEILLLCSGFFVAFALAHGFRRRKVFRWACGILITYGVLQAMYGLVVYWTGGELSIVKRDVIEGAAGTFYNRNHYVDFVAMIFPLAVVLWVTRLRQLLRQAPKDRWGRIRMLLNAQNGILPILTMAVGVLALGIAFSLSRGGIASLCVVIALMMIFPPRPNPGRHQARTPRTLHRRWVRVISVVVLLGLALVLWVGPRPILERFARTEQELEIHKNRLAAWKDALQLVIHSPITGTGPGTFSEAFPLVQSFDIGLRWTYAHNDYLQLLTETGILGCFLMVLFAIGIVRFLRRHRPGDSEYLLYRYGCSMGMIYLLLHAMVDFNFHIPANVLIASSLLGMSLALSIPRVQIMDETVTRKSPVERGVPILAFIMLVVTAWISYRHLPQAMLTDALRVTARDNPPVSDKLLNKARDYLKRPDGPSRLFQYYGVRVSMNPDKIPLSAASFYKALVLNPQDFISAHNLAQIFWKAYPSFRLAERFFDLALRAAPSESVIWYQAGLFAWTTGQLDVAMDRFRRAGSLNPSLLPSIYAQLRPMGDPDRMITVTPPEQYPLLARTLLRYGFKASAQKVLSQILSSKKVDAITSVLDLVVMNPDLGLTDAYLTFLQPWRDKDPEIGFWEIHARLARGDKTNIADAVRNVVREAERVYGIRDRRVLDIRRDLGRLLSHYGFRRTAESLLLEIINLDPRYLEAYRELGRLAFEEGRLARAFDYFKKAPMDATTGAWLFRTGEVALKQGDIALARSIYEYMRLRWIYRDRGLYGLARVLVQEGDPWKAVEYLNEALKLKPDAVEYRLLRAKLLEEIGRSDEARKDYEAILAVQPGHPEALNQLILWADRRGNAEEKRTLCQQASDYGLNLFSCSHSQE